MNQPSNTDQAWQLEYTDASSLRGDVVASLLTDVSKTIGSRHVMVRDVEGSGLLLERLAELGGRRQMTSVSELTQVLGGVSQLDWGEIAFGAADDDAKELRQLDPVSVVARVQVLVRAVDSNYLYLYGRSKELIERLQTIFPGARVSRRPLGELEFPD